MAKDLVRTYLGLREKLISWERQLKAADDVKEARGVAEQIAKYIDDEYGGKEFPLYIKKIQDILGPQLS